MCVCVGGGVGGGPGGQPGLGGRSRGSHAPTAEEAPYSPLLMPGDHMTKLTQWESGPPSPPRGAAGRDRERPLDTHIVLHFLLLNCLLELRGLLLQTPHLRLQLHEAEGGWRRHCRAPRARGPCRSCLGAPSSAPEHPWGLGLRSVPSPSLALASGEPQQPPWPLL